MRRMATAHFHRHSSRLGIANRLDPSKNLPFQAALVLDPVALISNEVQTLIQALIATWILALIERRGFREYGIPVRNAFGRTFRVGLAWGLGSATLFVGLIAAFGGYRILGLAVHGAALWYFLVLWTIANLLIGFSEEIQFRAYLLATTADGIGFWAAAILLSVGFGALHYFFKPHERWEDFECASPCAAPVRWLSPSVSIPPLILQISSSGRDRMPENMR
jgi:membrane protease YdiL (CAAX protease family)